MLMSDKPKDRFVRRASIALLSLSVMGAALAVYLHSNAPQPQVMDLVIPPALLLAFAMQLFYLYRNPWKVEAVLRFSFMLAFLALVIPAWFYSLSAHFLPDGSLIQTLPPIVPLLFPVTIGFVLFLRPREVAPSVAAAWLLIGGPILLYLVAHPAELFTPRGHDLAIALLPSMAIVYVMLQFHQRMRSGLGRLEAETSLLKTLAHRDSLTGLYNRRAGDEFLARLAVDHGTARGLIMFDIDCFKEVNDTHGHAVGDSILREVARCCGDRLRRQDYLVRWGGEEFLVILVDADEQACENVAETLRSLISQQSFPQVGSVTASFGIAVLVSPESPAEALARADAALYRAKAAGRNRVELARRDGEPLSGSRQFQEDAGSDSVAHV